MTRQIFAIGLAAAALCGTARAELIVNGSFEDGAFAPANGYAMVIEPGATAMTGWEAINASFAWIGQGDPWGLDASDGNLFLDLTGWRTGAPFGGVRQTIATLPGRQYLVSLALGSSSNWGRPSAVTVSAADAVETFTSPVTGSTNDWQTNEMTFVATAAQTTISIVGSAGVNYIGLDDVSVVDLSGNVVVGGREWRQLTDTTYVTWNEVAAVCPVDGTTPCSGSILRSQDGALIDVTGWTWARSSDVQALFEAIIQPAVINFPTDTSTYTAADDPDIERALSGAPEGFEPTWMDAAGRYIYGLTATTSAASPDAANRPGVRDAIPGNSDWVKLATTLPKTSRQSYTGAWLLRPAGGSLDLQLLSLKSTEVAGCKSVSGTVTLSAPAPAGGVVVTLADTLAAATTPATVKLLEGATYKSFTVQTVAVAARQTGTVSARLGSTTLSQPLALRPMGMLSVALVPTKVAGTQPVAGTAKLECKAGPGPVTVNLASSQPAVAQPVAPAVVVSQGLQSASFDVTTSKVLAKATASISGTANGITKSKTLTVTPAAVVSPTALRFGSVLVGATSVPLNATLTNAGAVSIAIDSIAVTGTYAAWFPMTENCPASLAPGASCTIAVSFQPLAAASRSAKVSIASSATASPVTVALSGTGVLSQ
jgi:hypothetical protein